jgi:hypothetical protein
MGVAATPKCPTNSDSNSDYNSSYKGTDLQSVLFSKDSKKEKRLGEEVRGGEAELYRIARESFGGENGASVVAKAINKGGMSWPDIYRVMAEEIDAGNTGDAQSLAYALCPSWLDW